MTQLTDLTIGDRYRYSCEYGSRIGDRFSPVRSATRFRAAKDGPSNRTGSPEAPSAWSHTRNNSDGQHCACRVPTPSVGRCQPVEPRIGGICIAVHHRTERDHMAQDSVTVKAEATNRDGVPSTFTLIAKYPKDQGLPAAQSISRLDEDKEQLEELVGSTDIETGLLEWTSTYTSDGLSVDIEFSVQFEGGESDAQEPTKKLLASVTLFAHSLSTGSLATQLLKALIQAGDMSVMRAYSAAGNGDE